MTQGNYANYLFEDTTFSQAQTSVDLSPNISPTIIKEPELAVKDCDYPKKALTCNSSKSCSESHQPRVQKDASIEKLLFTPSTLTKRNSWLSNLSLRFSSNSSNAHLTSSSSSVGNTESATTNGHAGPIFLKQAILPHAHRPIGDEPYIPASPRVSNPSFLQNAFRRLSNSNNTGTVAQTTVHKESGICERRVLNVDKNRERCDIKGLNQSKLRRVAFCVDVQIASCLKGYEDGGTQEKAHPKKKRGKYKQTKKLSQPIQTTKAKKPAEEGEPIHKVGPDNEPEVIYFPTTRSVSRKKEKKKRQEEERKARKEKNRRLAEAHGDVPLEVIISNNETLETVPKVQKSPTTDPLRIYKRCCQLRESHVVKRIAEQLLDLPDYSQNSGIVNRLDLTGHYFERSDMITFCDYLAVVPIYELVLENCALTDEDIRAILAGLLATKPPESESKLSTKRESNGTNQGGFIARLVLKNNPGIGSNGWQYICTFIAMCHSLNLLDISQIPFNQPSSAPETFENTETDQNTFPNDLSHILGNALSRRVRGKELKLLNMAECGLTSFQIGNIIDGIISGGLSRLCMAGNNISFEGIKHIGRYIRTGDCKVLDLSGNNLGNELGAIADALNEENTLHSLSLAGCNLSLDHLWDLLSALAKLKNFRFIDLSNNPLLFGSEPNALTLFRRYLPQMKTLKRVKLMSVSLTSDQAIALAEILPEVPCLAHINIMENPLRAALEPSDKNDKLKQEEACALYTSLMVAVHLSKTLICVDIEVPSSESSDLVKALARQVVAHCLWNMEQGSMAEVGGSEIQEVKKDIIVPDIFLHLINHKEELAESPGTKKFIVPDDNYIIGGSGIVKALSICLNNLDIDARTNSIQNSITTRDSATIEVRANTMSKTLLNLARNIHSQLQLTIRESKIRYYSCYQNLLSLNQIIEDLIQRFEDKFPEISLISTTSSPPSSPSEFGDVSCIPVLLVPDSQYLKVQPTYSEISVSDDESSHLKPVISKSPSDLSVAGTI
ncbi:putative cell wall biogenesis protein mhp1 [Golovinomyces cichoracearum]|uniref:Putative cell wall biogenesis protein mhp1 n=1 Tax=Golovinomyces cichoracearum TaxID=62708 RepID=A0A420ILM6_9PEZI|nr:putative cell wall biogenesis protein mhp1 [Golovinomyces cichoracearum]